MPRALVFYHYLPPDDVVSAKQFGDLCVGLKGHGWEVLAIASNRSCHHPKEIFPNSETLDGVRVERTWRPPLSQASTIGRIVNATCLLFAWAWALWRHRKFSPDIILFGTDPILSPLLAVFSKLILPRAKVAHWCFDLYPELAFADGVLKQRGIAGRFLTAAMRKAYARCDLLVDVGPCMRKTLENYGPKGRQISISPWALLEPSQPLPPCKSERETLFGDARIALLYSGSLGRGHRFEEFLELARDLRGSEVRLAFSVRGTRVAELKRSIRPDDCINLADFVPEAKLASRLSAADVHLVSLQPEWRGLILPSKFFGSLAIGRPILFVGPRSSAIAQWIEKHSVGWVLDDKTYHSVRQSLLGLSENRDSLIQMQRHCWGIYQTHFARTIGIQAWNLALR